MVPPTVLALLACDRASRTRGRGGYDLFGVFHAINLPLPCRLTFAAYYAFTGCHGAQTWRYYSSAPTTSRSPPARW